MRELPVAISYSGGASSEWMVRAVINGTIPRPAHLCVVLADTGAEHGWTYEAVASVEAEGNCCSAPLNEISVDKLKEQP